MPIKTLTFYTLRLTKIVMTAILYIALMQTPVAAANKCQKVVQAWKVQVSTYGQRYEKGMAKFLKKKKKELKAALAKELKASKKTTGKKWEDPEDMTNAVIKHVYKMNRKLEEIYFEGMIEDLDSFARVIKSHLKKDLRKWIDVHIEQDCTGD